ncbi:MAG: O-antigen polysaccharide polymerase Wzy [Candidatus Didemnitutus sp.]|nr:O-antigen polysaccharide polymerase Wzy [Candidatus Didemnitutus sp.]
MSNVPPPAFDPRFGRSPEETAATDPLAPPISYHLTGRRSAAQSRTLFLSALWAVILGSIYLGFKAKVDDVLHLYLGLIIIALSMMPALLWLKNGGSRFPVFEPLLALCAPSYGLPLLNGHEQLVTYPADTITLAGIAIVAYQLSAILLYYSVKGLPGRGSFWTESVLSTKVERLIFYGIVLSTSYMAVAGFTDWIPYELGSVLRAIFNGISILCTFITAQRWGRDDLTQSEKWIFGSMLLLQMIIMSSSLLLIYAITLCGIGLLGFLSAGRQLPWIAVLSIFVCFAVLHNGKTRMREIYWEGDNRAMPTVGNLSSFFGEWIEYGLQNPLREKDEKASSVGNRLLERTSLMHILCMIVEFTPDKQPYLYGETYGYVLPQLIPRFFWQDKPRSHVATYRLSIYYGLQEEEATQKTTIAFGLPAEAYANFGILGMIMLGATFGFILKKLQVLSAHSPMFSLAGLMMVLLTAWSFNTELTMAAWVSSFYQAVIVALGLPLILRGLLGV